MEIFDPEFQPNWCLDKSIELAGTKISNQICVPSTFGNLYIEKEELASRFINATPAAPSYVLCGEDSWVKEQKLYKEVYGK